MRRSKRAEAIPEPSTIKGFGTCRETRLVCSPDDCEACCTLADAAGFVYIPTVRPIRSPIRESAETCTSNDSGHKIHGMVILRHDVNQSQYWGQSRNLGLSSSSCNRPTLANQSASPLKHESCNWDSTEYVRSFQSTKRTFNMHTTWLTDEERRLQCCTTAMCEPSHQPRTRCLKARHVWSFALVPMRVREQREYLEVARMSNEQRGNFT